MRGEAQGTVGAQRGRELAECGVVREGLLEEGMCKLDLKAGKKQGESRGGRRYGLSQVGDTVRAKPRGEEHLERGERQRGLYCLVGTRPHL